ncbi:MAG: N,N'-diacetylchitobiose phosphorylase, partial [Clostridiales bacterium]|nr:N,N'-diacetylchitobiose phosphorylase [Clostridiales bacterium]
EGILGLKPEADGIVIEPCIPSDWDGFTMKKVFRGKTLNVTVDNSAKKQKGVSKLVVNGEEIDGKLILESILKDENEVVITM